MIYIESLKIYTKYAIKFLCQICMAEERCLFSFLQTYGFHHAVTLANLEKAQLLKVQTAKTYGAIRKGLRLIVEDVSEQVKWLLIKKNSSVKIRHANICLKLELCHVSWVKEIIMLHIM